MSHFPPEPPKNQGGFDLGDFQRRPPARPPTRVVLIILLVLGLPAFLCIGGFGILGFWAKDRLNREVTMPKNAGKPEVIAKLESHWVKVRFPEGPITVELPGKPALDPEGPDFPEASVIYEHLVFYVSNEKPARESVVISGLWPTIVGNLELADTDDFVKLFSEDFIKKPKRVALDVPSNRRVYVGGIVGGGGNGYVVFHRTKRGDAWVFFVTASDDPIARTAAFRVAKSLRDD